MEPTCRVESSRLEVPDIGSTLAYYDMEYIMTVQSFTVQALLEQPYKEL